MAIKWQGSIVNRLMEASKDPEIVVGMGVTECFWSDREPYEVIAVKDQKHITIRRMGHRKVTSGFSLDPIYDNDWELFSDTNNREEELVKRGKYWYTPFIETDLDGNEHRRFCRRNLYFGSADYYYDYSF